MIRPIKKKRKKGRYTIYKIKRGIKIKKETPKIKEEKYESKEK